MKEKIKFLLFVSALLTISDLCFCQSDTLFFNTDWQSCGRSEATYYRIVIIDKQNFIVRDMYVKSNTPQMIAVCSSADPVIKNGKCTFYGETGVKESEGVYKTDKKTGVWTWWDDDGKDSTVAEYLSNGNEKIIRRSENMTTGPPTFMYVEQMPEFPGGIQELMKFLQKNLKYPEEARKKKIEGRVVVQFTVELDGSIDEIKVLREVGGGCNEEAVRVVKMMPLWKPGKQNGDVVKVYYKLPITFNLAPETREDKKKQRKDN